MRFTSKGIAQHSQQRERIMKSEYHLYPFLIMESITQFNEDENVLNKVRNHG